MTAQQRALRARPKYATGGALTREFREGVDEGEVSLAPPTLFPEQDAAVGNKNEEQNEMNERDVDKKTQARKQH